MATITPLTFNPTSIAGCQLWLDASDRSTVILSGTNVARWNDKSGNGRNATTSGVITYSLSQLPLPSLNFNSSVTGGNVSGSLSYSSNTYTVFSVFQLKSTAVSGGRLFAYVDSGGIDFNTTTSMIALLLNGTPPTANLVAYRNGSFVSSNSTTMTSNVSYLGCSQYTGTSNIIYLNGDNNQDKF